jgi:pimeloyl-ACP methyl ester carboxylesterase
MGGAIGLMLAARHPEALSRLMVVDILPFMGAMFGPPD